MKSKMNKLLALFFYFSLTIFSAVGQHEQIAQIEDLIDQEQYEKGLEIIDKVISKHPTNVVYYYKAYCEQQKKLFEAATVSASLALKITTKTDTLYTRILFYALSVMHMPENWIWPLWITKHC
jgi:hypothetical protein